MYFSFYTFEKNPVLLYNINIIKSKEMRAYERQISIYQLEEGKTVEFVDQKLIC